MPSADRVPVKTPHSRLRPTKFGPVYPPIAIVARTSWMGSPVPTTGSGSLFVWTAAGAPVPSEEAPLPRLPYVLP
jgi:hypothetical protein